MHAHYNLIVPTSANWAGAVVTGEQHIDVTVTTPSSQEERDRLLQALQGVYGVRGVQAPMAAQCPPIPLEMEEFATHLWEVL